MRELKTVHGGKGTAEYRIWKHMRARCSNPHDKRFNDYGGRGIKVCARWDDFELFRKDMGPRPSPAYSIERLDVNGDYEPGNCVWATMKEQARNKRSTSYIIIDGEKRKLMDVAEELGMKPGTLHKRAQRGTGGLFYVKEAS